MTLKIHLDSDKCEGHGRCYALAEELFEPDDLGQGVVVGDGTVPQGLEHKAELAMKNCPERAITISQE
jgi:ferredoxin